MPSKSDPRQLSPAIKLFRQQNAILTLTRWLAQFSVYPTFLTSEKKSHQGMTAAMPKNQVKATKTTVTSKKLTLKIMLKNR